MSDIKFKFIGWCHEDGHDKVWTSFEVDDKWYCAWGRRGGKLQFKRHSWGSPLVNLESKKRQKGYKEVDAFMLFTVFPDFQDKVDKELFMSTLAGKVL